MRLRPLMDYGVEIQVADASAILAILESIYPGSEQRPDWLPKADLSWYCIRTGRKCKPEYTPLVSARIDLKELKQRLNL